ncbi:MAG TPA: hypothetical protein PK993_00135 [Clostridia bacterium]|nr:hypothetical protein [Clostridia bacterium]
MKKIRLSDIITYLFVFSLILECNSVYNRIVGLPIKTEYFYYGIQAIFLFYILNQCKKIRKYDLIFVEILALLGLLFLFLNVSSGEAIIAYIIKFIILLPTLILYFRLNTENVNRLCKAFVDCSLVLAVISLILYLLFITNVFGDNTVLVKWGGSRQINHLFYMQFNMQNSYSFGTMLLRNTGIFTESPMYSYILTLALAFNYLNFNKVKHYILLITIITTFSTTGIIAAGIIVFINSFIAENKKNIIKKIILPFIIAILSIVAVNLIEMKMENESWSYNLRFEDYIVSYLAWNEHPLVGNGYENTSKSVSYMNHDRRKDEIKHGQSNAVGRLLAEGGIFLFLYYMIPTFKTIIQSYKKHDKSFLSISISFFILIISTNIPYQMITMFMLSLLFNYNRNYIKEMKYEKL